MKRYDDTVIDAALNIIKNNATNLVFCSDDPVNYAGVAAVTLCTKTPLTAGNYTGPADDAVAPYGRKLTVNAITGMTPSSNGVMTYAVLTNGSTTLYAGTEVGAVQQTGTAQAGGATTITLSSGATATDNIYQNYAVRIKTGTGAGQTRKITGYVGSTKVATVGAAWTTNPDATSVYEVFGQLVATTQTWDSPAFKWQIGDPT